MHGMDTPRTIIVTRTTPDAARYDPDALILAPVAQQMLGAKQNALGFDGRHAAGMAPKDTALARRSRRGDCEIQRCVRRVRR